VLYPPKNTILNKIHINIILAYSAKKKNTNITAECSVINPLTNSDSASAKSKGALFVSATEAIKNIINIGNRGTINQIGF
jgi:tricorn protease-like protein